MAKEKTRNSGRWTEARWRSFVTSALRSASRRWPPKYEAIKEAYVSTRINKKSGRKAKHYRCAICGETFPQTQIQVDHIVPLGKGLDWNQFIEALYCEKENLQTVCKPCHKIKTKKENN